MKPLASATTQSMAQPRDLPGYMNNVVEQAQRVVKRIIRPMPGFNSFDAAHGP